MNPPSDQQNRRLLVIDDEQGMRDLLSMEFQSKGYQVMTAANGEEAVAILERHKFNVVVSDIKMPKMGGLEVLDVIKAKDPLTEVIMATGFGTVETAIGAMKRGAYDYILKPFNLDEINLLVDKAYEKSQLKESIGIHELSEIVFTTIEMDKLMPKICQAISRVLKSDELIVYTSTGSGDIRIVYFEGSSGRDVGPGRNELVGRLMKDKNLISQPNLFVTGYGGDHRFANIPGIGDIGSSIFCPLHVNAESWGCILANRSRDGEVFTAMDVQNMLLLSSHIAQAVQNANLYEHLKNINKELDETNKKLKETQSLLFQTEKLAAVGQLAAGVAHELNNPLTGILGFTQLLLQDTTLTGPQKEDLESIHQQSQRCRKIVQNLLRFSRKLEPSKEPIMTGRLIDSTLELLKYEVNNSNIVLVKEWETPGPAIMADFVQMQEVLINLITNARQAMEDMPGAKLTIRTQREDSRVLIRIQDGGRGIDPEVLPKIFDPFFTTKPVGKGTGLGLSIAYGIVQEHGGTIRVSSKMKEGSAFTIELPLYEGAVYDAKREEGAG